MATSPRKSKKVTDTVNLISQAIAKARDEGGQATFAIPHLLSALATQHPLPPEFVKLLYSTPQTRA